MARPPVHGESQTRLYGIWHGMKQRCLNKNAPSYRLYGGRGISLDPSWHSFLGFRAWALAKGYRDNLSIERKKVDGDYCPKNCCWIDPKYQQRNKSDTLWVDWGGIKRCAADWAEIFDVDKQVIRKRYLKGIRGAALFAPAKKQGEKVYIEYKGERKTLTEWSKTTGIKRKTLAQRLYAGDKGDALFAPLHKGEKA